MSQSEKRLCANRAEYVAPSKHNDNGRCSCLSCIGMNCETCGISQERNATDAVRRANVLRCAKCRCIIENQR
ncbi:MAG: hypothetical protein J6K82_03685 [Alphaproteobacteria bacterium]|nr:hypothetical protein [Alphaproteobacteria bacterium]